MDEEALIKKVLETHFAGIEDSPGTEIIQFQEKEVIFNKEDRTKDIDNDYEAVRKVLRVQLQMMDAASKAALTNALMSGSARHTEVFSSLMTTMTVTAEKLLKVQKQMNELEGKQPSDTGGTIHAKNVFFGSTNDLLTTLGGSQDIRDSKIIEHEPIKV